MNVAELMERLEGMDPDAEVRIAEQPEWPFEYSIHEVVEVDLNEANEDGSYNYEDDEPYSVVYIGDAIQLGYLPGAATEALGWK